jgi:hypothetical protein
MSHAQAVLFVQQRLQQEFNNAGEDERKKILLRRKQLQEIYSAIGSSDYAPSSSIDVLYLNIPQDGSRKKDLQAPAKIFRLWMKIINELGVEGRLKLLGRLLVYYKLLQRKIFDESLEEKNSYTNLEITTDSEGIIYYVSPYYKKYKARLPHAQRAVRFCRHNQAFLVALMRKEIFSVPDVYERFEIASTIHQTAGDVFVTEVLKSPEEIRDLIIEPKKPSRGSIAFGYLIPRDGAVMKFE